MGESAVDCDGLSSMPNVSFTIGGRVFDLSPEQVWCNLYGFTGCSLQDMPDRTNVVSCLWATWRNELDIVSAVSWGLISYEFQ
jgi:hypothetical protein